MQNQIAGVVRIVVPTILAYAVGAGWLHLSGEEVASFGDAIVNLILGIVGIVMGLLSWRANSPKQIFKSATELEAVERIDLKPTPQGRDLAAAVAPNPQATIVFTPQ